MIRLGLNPFFTPEDTIVVADLHARLQALKELLKKVLPLKPGVHLVFTGDLLDRGLDVFEVLDLLLSLKKEYPHQVFFLKGNHDDALLKFLYDNYKILKERSFKNWLKTGGDKTYEALCSRYKSSNHSEILEGFKKDGYLDIFESMIPYYETEKIFVSHAPLDGFLLGFYDKLWNEEDKNIVFKKLEGIAEKMEHKLWTKFVDEIPLDLGNRFLSFKDFDKTFICGHQSSQSLTPRILENRIFLDTNSSRIYAYSALEKKIV